jgi:hypothetical protein
VILSVGIIGIYHPFLAAYAALHDQDKRAEASRIATNALWLLQAEALEQNALNRHDDRGTVLGAHTIYDYWLKAEALSEQEDLFQANYSISWQQGGRRKNLTRVAYVWVPKVA